MRKMMVPVLLLGACTDAPSDPAEGGFIAGLSGITSGSYQAGIDAQDVEIEESRTRNAQLAAQIDASEIELAQLKQQIRTQSRALPRTDAATVRRIDGVLASSGSGNTPNAKLAALQKAISDARALSADLSRLSSG